METKIRPAKVDEADELSALCMISKQSHGYDDAFMTLCVDELKVTSERINEGSFWVAERGSICGCACLQTTGEFSVGEVTTFFIHPDFQNQGVGSLLWKQILKIAHERNLTKLHLDADPFAEPFYAKLGFKTVGRTPSGSIEGRTIPYMELLLETVV